MIPEKCPKKIINPCFVVSSWDSEHLTAWSSYRFFPSVRRHCQAASSVFEACVSDHEWGQSASKPVTQLGQLGSSIVKKKKPFAFIPELPENMIVPWKADLYVMIYCKWKLHQTNCILLQLTCALKLTSHDWVPRCQAITYAVTILVLSGLWNDIK